MGYWLVDFEVLVGYWLVDFEVLVGYLNEDSPSLCSQKYLVSVVKCTRVFRDMSVFTPTGNPINTYSISLMYLFVYDFFMTLLAE